MIRIKISIGIIAAIIVLGAVGFFMLKNETDEIIAMLDETRELSDNGKKEEALDRPYSFTERSFPVELTDSTDGYASIMIKFRLRRIPCPV